jgi:hypothetical protein
MERTFNPEGCLSGSYRRQCVLDLHQLPRRAARHRKTNPLSQFTRSPRREKDKGEEGSRNLKVVREKEY